MAPIPLISTQSVMCPIDWWWGYNGSGQLGDGTGNNRVVPTPVKGLTSGVRVKSDAVQEQSFQLVPSPDTIAAYEARAQRLRFLAWGTTGLAAVGAGLFIGFLAHANALYGSPTTEGTFSWAKAQLDQGVEAFDSTDYRQLATRLQGQVNTAQAVWMVSLGVAAASAVAATVLWIVGEDPGRYARYQEVKVAFVPSVGGLALVF